MGTANYLSQPPLPEVSSCGGAAMARRARGRASAGSLLSRGIVRLNSILPAGTPEWDGAPLFLLTNRQGARRDSTPKMAYTILP